MMDKKYLIEVAIYRLPESKYYNDLQEHIDKSNVDSAYSRKQFGGDWQYNEIIGYLKFYQYDKCTIRCDYWETDSKRKVRTRKKQFVQISDSYCNEKFSINATNQELANILKEALTHCESRLSNRRYIDREVFDNTVDYVDWMAVLSRA